MPYLVYDPETFNTDLKNPRKNNIDNSMNRTNIRRCMVKKVLQKAKKLNKIHILITHEPPLSLRKEYDNDKTFDYKQNVTDLLIKHLNPEFCICGDLHQKKEAQIGNTKVIVLNAVNLEDNFTAEGGEYKLFNLK